MVLPLLQQPLFLCHFSRFLAFFLQLPPLPSVFPLLLPPPCFTLPLLLLLCLLLLYALPLQPASFTGSLLLCSLDQIQEHFQWELLSSSLFCLSYDPLSNNKQQCFFVKNKSQKYKVSELQLKTALDN